MKTNLLLFPFFCMAVAINSSCGICSKKIDCPGFQDTLLTAWFPYKDNDQVVFRNNLNEQENFTLKNTQTTDPYQKTSGFNVSSACSAEKVFESEEKDSFNIPKFSVQLQVYSNTTLSASASLYIDRTSVYFMDLKDTAFLQVTIMGRATVKENFATLNLINRSFTNVIAATRDTSIEKSTGIYKIYYAKSKGIIGYSEYPSLKTWVKQ